MLALLAITAVAAIVRLRFLGEPIRYDEAYSFLHFAARPLHVGLTHYPLPNNHLLYTALVHGGWRLFGDAPWVLRLPALVAGVLLIPALYATTRMLYDRNAALLAAGLATPCAALVEYSVNGRGYTLVCLIFVLLLGLGARLLQRPNPAVWVLWSVLAALGLYTVPVMAFALVIVAAWMAAGVALDVAAPRRRALAGQLALALAGAGAGALALLSPTLGQPGWNYRHAAPAGLAVDVWNSWNAGVAGPLRVVVAVGVLAALVLHRRIARLRAPVASGLLVLAPLLLVVPVPPFERSWLFLAPLYCMLAGAGLAALPAIALRSRRSAAAVLTVAASGAAAVLGLALARDALPNRADPPLRDGERVTAYLARHLRPGQRVAVSELTAPNFRYYFRRTSLDQRALTTRPAGTPGTIVVVSRVRGETLTKRLGALALSPSHPPLPVRRYPSTTLYRLR